MGFWSNISPTGAIKDFSSNWSGNPYRWPALAVSIALTAGILYAFLPASERIDPRSPDVTYITTYAEGRSDTEITASNLENQKRKDVLAADQTRREEFRKDAYRALGRATGLDVDAMEQQIAEDEAAKKRAADTRRANAEQARATESGATENGATENGAEKTEARRIEQR